MASFPKQPQCVANGEENRLRYSQETNFSLNVEFSILTGTELLRRILVELAI
jgi:hypothetical protein